MKEKADERKAMFKDNPPTPTTTTPNPNRGGRPEEWTPERCELEAIDLEKWSKQPDAIVLEEFGLYREPPYIRSQLYDLGRRNARFSHALMVAKERIRSRREGGGVSGKFNASMIQFTHGFYDRDKNNTDISFTRYKDDRKKVDDGSDISKQRQAIIESQAFVDEARKKLEEKDKGE